MKLVVIRGEGRQAGAWQRATSGGRLPRSLGAAWLALSTVAGLIAVIACSKPSEVVVHSAANAELTLEEIERDPLALLPARAISLGYLDLKQLFVSELGGPLLSIWSRRAPIPAQAGFEPTRDLDTFYFGSYSMQGADFVGVAVGRFDPGRLEQAAAMGQKTPTGVPFSETNYAGRRLFVAEELGFVALTPRLLLIGNPTGVRRALDRVKERRLKRQTSSWFNRALETQPVPPIVLGADFRTSPLPDAVKQKFPPAVGLDTVAVVGNFQPPGINLAGTLGYKDEAQAQMGGQQLLAMYQNLNSYGMLMQLMGVGQPVRKLDARAESKDLRVVAELDGPSLRQLLEQADRWLLAGKSFGGQQ